MYSNSVQQIFIEFALFQFNVNVKNKYLYSYANSNETHFCQKKIHMRSLKKKKSESKLTRQQKMRFPFLGISIKEELLFIKDFQY